VVRNTRSNNVGATILYVIPFAALLPLTPPLPTAIVSQQQQKQSSQNKKKRKQKKQQQQQEEENP
jgi:Ni,Fe-hydrogenase III small subunit